MASHLNLPLVNAALDFERAHFATGPCASDPFYNAPPESLTAAPGKLLTLESEVDSAKYSLPLGTALSRFVYQSATYHGTPVPVSAAILWPFHPRVASDGKPAVISWAHGTSGITLESAPSHQKNLWQHHLGPFAMAVQGYVVVMTDYAGLGVGRDAGGEKIVHEYLCCDSQANDVVYAVLAAREAFPDISTQWVVVGHSQGGGAAWAVARRQVECPVDGYLGAVAASPVTRLLSEPMPWAGILTTGMALGLESIGRGRFRREDILTEEGVRRLDKIEQDGGGLASTFLVLQDVELVKNGWRENDVVNEVQDRIANGGKKIAGPLMIIHGEQDYIYNIGILEDAVSDTMKKYPESQICYLKVAGITHNAALTSVQHTWMDWIKDRFDGKSHSGFEKKTIESMIPAQRYQGELNWFIETSTEPYQFM